MNGIITYVVDNLSKVGDLGPYVYLVAFLVTFLESVPVIGTFMPGTILMLLFGFIASQGYGNIYILIIVSVIGGVLGDMIGYYLGIYGRKYFSKESRLFKHEYLELGRAFFTKHGGKSVAISRFIGPIRPVVPLLAGMGHMSNRRFMFWNVGGALIWAASYIFLGFIFGHEWQIVDMWINKVIRVVTLLITFFVLAYIIRGYVLARARKQKNS